MIAEDVLHVITSFVYLVETRFNSGKRMKSDKEDELPLNRSKNVVFVDGIEQLFFSAQRHFSLQICNLHRVSHSERIVTFVICRRVAIVAFCANQRIRIDLKRKQNVDSMVLSL